MIALLLSNKLGLSMKSKLLENQKLGFGTAPLGNMFRNIPEEEALATITEAWNQGIRYFDTAPFYGAGLAEIRLGQVLKNYNRDEYTLSSKVGRIILDEEVESQEFGEKGALFEHGRKNRVVNDYTASATLRSIEDSLKRLDTDSLDIVYVHDIAQDFYGDNWLAKFEEARNGAFKVLADLKKEGVIKSWGLGVNKVEPIELALNLEEDKPDAFLLAGRYTLLDHELALQRLMPKAAAQKVDIIVGGPYSSGILAGGSNFEYQKAPTHIVNKVAKIKAVCEKFSVSIKAVALQFVLANDAVSSVIPGASKPSRIAEDISALEEKLPHELWLELKREGVISELAPTPTK
ncbi:aldo/keto reductase [Pseudoalteromonas tetraodonis GFC]|uniref:Aldo/keto reductase n=1 Tax=Pseudoalteromonas tetraodonis GFC TaxID=1315271 RepID=A0AA37S0K4_9GAMM|nr:aldo/keto reductase [Pseudoalteromonas tetraodonis]ATD02015.1 D-threo-aldose 1-dehydrogenase [Pseudoalteromonas tetraodonis]GEN38932.1 aldo/keto reductase [Pseudoalteromonas tetraodonis GFC]GLQ01181.1 aldo/keto reductase [Pseudoalteromonas tetraodonis GFC]